VAYLSAGLTAPFMVQMTEGYRFGVGQVPGVTPKVAGPKVIDPVEQMKVMQELVRQGTPSISLSVPFAEMSEDAVEDAAAKNIRLIAIDTPPLPGSPVQLFVGNDNYAMGRQLADTVAAKLGPAAAGKIVLGSPRNGVPQLDARALGFREGLREKLPKVRVIGPLDTAERPDAAVGMWASVAKANKDAIGFASVGANAKILVDLRRKTKATWLAASFDIEPQALEAVKRGELVLVSPEHFLKGAVTGKVQAQYAGREAQMPSGWVEIPGVPVTAANVDEYIARDASEQSSRAWHLTRLDQIVGTDGPKLRPIEDAQ
jgi:ribose transport system substrate-binding protein